MKEQHKFYVYWLSRTGTSFTEILVYMEAIKQVCDSAGCAINSIRVVQFFIEKHSKENSLILWESEQPR